MAERDSREEWGRREERARALWHRPADVKTIADYLRATGSRKAVAQVIDALAALEPGERAKKLDEYRRHLARLTTASRHP